MRLVESLAEVLGPGAEGRVNIALLLEGFEAAEEPAAALAGHEGHLHLSPKRSRPSRLRLRLFRPSMAVLAVYRLCVPMFDRRRPGYCCKEDSRFLRCAPE